MKSPLVTVWQRYPYLFFFPLFNLLIGIGYYFDTLYHRLNGPDLLTTWTPPHAVLSVLITLTAIVMRQALRQAIAELGIPFRLGVVLTIIVDAVIMVDTGSWIFNWYVGLSPYQWLITEWTWLAGPVSSFVLCLAFTMFAYDFDHPVPFLLSALGQIAIVMGTAWALVGLTGKSLPGEFRIQWYTVLGACAFLLLKAEQRRRYFPSLLLWGIFGAVVPIIIAVLHMTGGYPLMRYWEDILLPIIVTVPAAAFGGFIAWTIQRFFNRLSGVKGSLMS